MHACLLSAALVLAGAAHGGEPRYYTPDRVAAGRENVAQYAWAQGLWQRLRRGDSDTYWIGRDYAPADTYVAQSDDFLWLLQPTTAIPRVFPDESLAVCPVHGLKVRSRNAFHPWNIDPIGHPYQLQCPVGGEWYPSNRYDQGDLTSGPYADAGDGFTVNGRTYYFLRDYAHRVYGNTTIPLLRSLSQAWLLTGDRRYAHAGCLLLARLASEYPNYEDRRDRLYFARYGGRSPTHSWKTGGLITDLIWETFCLEATAYAYDGLAAYYDQDPALLAFLRAKGLPATDGEALRQYIRQYLFRPAMQALLKGDVKGNEGFHQAAALAVALVMDDYGEQHPNSADLVDDAFLGRGHAAWFLVNGLLRDGGGHESPGYNAIKLDFVRVAKLMELVRARHPDRFPRDRYPDLFADPKTMSVFDWFLDYQLLDHYMLEIGDGGGGLGWQRVAPRQFSYLTSQNLYAFERTGAPRFARACTAVDGHRFDGELWERYPAAALDAALARPESAIVRRSRLLDASGVAILETGEGDHRRAAAVNYSSLIGHWQADSLFLGLFARGVTFLPDLGYPFSWTYRAQWDSNSLTHNTVTVDETQFAYHASQGVCRLLLDQPPLHVTSVAHDPYPDTWEPGRPAAHGVDRFERTVTLVDVSPTTFYTVDVYRVRGGTQHDQSWHGPMVVPTAPPLAWRDRGGTVAGAEVAQFAKWQDRWGRPRDDAPSFLTGVREAELAAPAVWTWASDLPTHEQLRLHLMPVDGPLQVIGCHGRSPARPADWRMDYVLARQTGPAPLASRFVTVLDTCQGDPVVRAVRVASREPLVLEIDHPGGTDRLAFELPDLPSRGTAPVPLGVTLQRGDRLTRVGGATRWRQTSVHAADPAANRVALPGPADAETMSLPGRYVRIYNGLRSAMFRVQSVAEREGLVWLDLDTSALLARGPVTATADGRVTLGAYLLFANGRVDAQGRLLGDPFFAGSVLGDGPAARRVAGVVRDESSVVHLAEPASAADLARDYSRRVVSIWQYGVGDQVEWPVAGP